MLADDEQFLAGCIPLRYRGTALLVPYQTEAYLRKLFRSWQLSKKIKAPAVLASIEFEKVIIASMFGDQIYRQLTQEIGVPPGRVQQLPGKNDFSEDWYIRERVGQSKDKSLLLNLLEANLDDLSPAKLADQINRLRSRDVPYEYWMHIYYRLCAASRYAVAHEAKQLAMKAEMEQPDPPVHAMDICARYTLLVASGRFDEARELVKHSSFFCKRNPFDYALFGNSAYLSGDRQTARKFWHLDQQQKTQHEEKEPARKTQRKHEQRFAEIITGKRIAIVGAANTATPKGEEIDDFDVVIRTNFRDHQQNQQRDTIYGKKTNVSYMNTLVVRDGEDHLLHQLVQSCKTHGIFLCTPPFIIDTIQRQWPSLACRSFTRYPGIYRGTLFATQSILIDIARYAPGTVKIFCTDLFSGPQKHHPHYVKYRDDAKSMILDDPVQNFLFAQKYLPGLVEYDELLTTVLTYSLNDYIDRFTGEYYQHKDT